MKNFVFLNLKDHPRGNYIISQLIKLEYYPSELIEEQSSLAEKNRQTLENDFDKHPRKNTLCPNSKTIKKQLRNAGTTISTVENHNNNTCLSIIKRNNPDIMLLGDTRIIKENIFSIPLIGTVNIHPGFLPNVRGNTPYVWASFFNLPQGCSSHFIDEGIDTGPLIERERISSDSIESYQDLLGKIHILCGKLAVNALKNATKNGLESVNQNKLQLQKNENQSIETKAPITFKLAPENIKYSVKMKLARPKNSN